MERAPTHPLPPRDPVSGGELVITEIEGADTGITIRGRFAMPRFARLSPEQAHYLETFLRCRGMLNSVERELGISYPTARGRLDAVLRALDLHPTREEGATAASEREAQQREATAFEDPTPDDVFFEPEPLEEIETIVPEAETVEEAKPSRLEVLAMLERGEITPERAKTLLGVAK